MRRILIPATAVLLLAFGPAVSSARIIYVDDGAKGDFRTIQAGIDTAAEGDIVLVGPGTYTGDGNRDIDFKGKAITVKSEQGPETCIIDCNGTREDHHRGFLFQRGENVDTVLQGISIRNGYSDTGAGIFCDGSSPTILNSIITHCTAYRSKGGGLGAGIYCYESDAVVRDCVLSENVAQPDDSPGGLGGYGGGIYCAKGAVVITHCLIKNNREGWSGAIHCLEASPEIRGCTILSNETSGVYCRTSKARIDDSSMIGNWQYGVICEHDDHAVIENCVIHGGTGSGSGVNCGYSSPTIRHCLVAGNRYAAFEVNGGSPMINSSTITGNVEVGLSCLGGCTCMVVNCIFWNTWNNKALPCQIRINSYSSETPVCRISYSNVQGGRNAVCVDRGVLDWGPGNIDADPCFADYGRWELDPNSPPPSNRKDGGGGRRFVWIDGDYHLKSQGGRWDPASERWVKDDVTSPCIDAGDPNSPVGDEPSPNGGRINMGAYGGTAEASMSPEPVCETIIPGDINGDCRVDFADLALLAANWLCTEQSLSERYSDLLKTEVINASMVRAGYHLLSYSRDEGPGPVFWAPQELRTAQAVPFLIRVLENGPDWTEEKLLIADGGMIPHIARCYAALCLGVSEDPRAFGPLVQQLKTGTFLEEKYKITSNHKDDYHISRYAALALGYFGDRRAVEPLIQTLLERGYLECAYAIGRLADLRAIWPIIDYLSENPQSGSVVHEVLTYLTMAQFTIEYSRKDKQFVVMEFPELGKMEAGEVDSKLWLHWRTAGQEYAERQFDQYYRERKNLVESYPDLSDLNSVCGILEREMIRGGIAVLPILMAKVANDDGWLIPYAAHLVRRGRMSDPTADTPLLLKPDATQAECLQWWKDNKDEWLIFSPSE